jgi:ankyrin repeat protein
MNTLFFLFSAESQLWSFPFSFLSLVFASSKLFFSQRLGIYSDEDPSLKMSLIVAPFNICILMGTLYSLVMMATYAQGYVVVLIGTIVLLNLIILKYTYLRKTHMDKIINNFYNKQKEFGTKEIHTMFLNALVTSWVSPCTVWTSNFLYNSKFLIVSSSITLSVHTINLINLYLIADSDIIKQIENPPILHCFNSHKNTSNISYNYYNSGAKNIINICKNNDDCLPVIRICSENEMPNTLMYTKIIPIGILLLFTSFSASICLQALSNCTKLFSFSRLICLACSKTFYWFVLDFVFSLDQNLKKQLLNELEKGVTRKILSQESLKNLFSHHHGLFKRSEETLSLYSKLEKISKENNTEEIPPVVWKLPPMHVAVHNNKLGLWCIMYILGGEAGALNGQAKSSINLIIEKEKREKHLFKCCNLVLKYLIKTATEVYGEYALHKAIKLSDNHLINILIANGYDIDESDSYNKTPLLLALEVQNIDYIKLLLQHDASVTDKDLELAASFQSFDCLKILLQGNTNITNLNTLLLNAAFYGELPLLKLLIENNADVNAKEGKTPLHMSAWEGDLECIKYLIDNKADVNAKDDEGNTPLHLSSIDGHFQCMKYLIDNKADVNAKDEEGNTPLHLSSINGHLECMKYLIENKADVHAKDDEGKTLLHYSAMSGHLELIKCMIDNKADVNLKDSNSQTPLHISAMKHHLECIAYLVENNADVNVMDLENNTPLHLVGDYLWSRPYQCAEFLIRAGADLNSSNAHGKTPMANPIVQKLKENKPELFI